MFYSLPAHRDLHSFPTRRSSDLGRQHPDRRRARRRNPARDGEHQRVAPAVARRQAEDSRPDQPAAARSEEHTSELQSLRHLVCRLLLEKKKKKIKRSKYIEKASV